jgi:sterol desaturase/sphingolipid hydroxylase (fatty acid hydroxylase superfamily)
MDTEQLAFIRGAVAVGCMGLLFALEGWLPFFGGRTGRVRHGLRNAALGVLNAALVVLLFAGPLTRVSEWVASSRFGLLHWLSLPPAATLLGAIVLFDAWMYGWHRANHRIPLLWRFHRMHHSEKDLDVTSAVRFHPGEIMLSSGLRLGVLAALGMSLPLLIIYELALAPVIQFHHSNVRLPERLDRWLRAVIVTPHMHRIHHSVLRREHDGNYASIFSFWDRLFGSYRRRENLREMPMGLRRWEGGTWQTLWGMFKTPLR